MVAISPYSQKTDQGLGKGFLMKSIPYTPYRGVKGGGGEWPFSLYKPATYELLPTPYGPYIYTAGRRDCRSLLACCKRRYLRKEEAGDVKSR